MPVNNRDGHLLTQNLGEGGGTLQAKSDLPFLFLVS